MPVLTKLLREYASGRYSFRTLALELNGKGHRTSSGKPFTESSISTLLNNRFYDGKTVYHRGQPDEAIRDGLHDVTGEVKELWQRCHVGSLSLPLNIKGNRGHPFARVLTEARILAINDAREWPIAVENNRRRKSVE